MGPQARQQARGGGPDRVQRRLAVEPRQIALEKPHRGVLSCCGSARRRRRLRASWRERLHEVWRRQLHDDPALLAIRGARSGRRTSGRRLARPAGSCRSDPRAAPSCQRTRVPRRRAAGTGAGLGGQRAHAPRRVGERGRRAPIPSRERTYAAANSGAAVCCARPGRPALDVSHPTGAMVW